MARMDNIPYRKQKTGTPNVFISEPPRRYRYDREQAAATVSSDLASAIASFPKHFRKGDALPFKPAFSKGYGFGINDSAYSSSRS